MIVRPRYVAARFCGRREYVATYKREPLYADRVQGSAIAVVAIVVPLQAAIATGGGVLVPL